ncbi:MAG: hypothetical protein CVU23_06425 [Betaproteobacteria bacterium HGW-Betaproteobacteria-17]|nr:MAG: hypothetical protein CVU23_06425 [Betaproteobacteria bacterium HGW-Betaproteobacteria-17]
MLRTLLIASTLLAASGTAMARGDYGHGRVVSVEPNFVISFGTRHHDGFRVLVESGGARYWTHSPYHPGQVIALPPPHRVTYVQPYRGHERGWDKRWDNRRDGWRDDRRGHRSDHRDHRDHRRHGRD